MSVELLREWFGRIQKLYVQSEVDLEGHHGGCPEIEIHDDYSTNAHLLGITYI